MNDSKERWLPVVGWEYLYKVSDLGRVRSCDRVIVHKNGTIQRHEGRVLKATQNMKGYLRVGLSGLGKLSYMYVHRLVLQAFVGLCPDGMECCHNNGVPYDNRLVNLRWDTHLENNWESMVRGTGGTVRHSKHGMVLVESSSAESVA